VPRRDGYTTFIHGLLDVTDNRVGGEPQPPPDTVAYDEPDTYLVVAADKGTARMSDTANSVAAQQSFWLGDAFASGGSTGYDHKAMGITARGAWVAVARHFTELGTDVAAEPITVVGIGDMSGDCAVWSIPFWHSWIRRHRLPRLSVVARSAPKHAKPLAAPARRNPDWRRN
jgi:NAD-specific glutamate dehydrogenase